MRLMCLDVGFLATGLVIVEDGDIAMAECFMTQKGASRKKIRKSDDDVRRCQEIFRWLLRVRSDHDEAGKPIQGIVAELPVSGGQSARAVGAMARAQALVAAFAEASCLPTEWVSPDDLKKAAVGRRDASKKQIQNAVLRRWNKSRDLNRASRDAESRWEHVADAAASYIAVEHGDLVRALAQQQDKS